MILVDSHVHLHACFAPDAFLDAAAGHMAKAARALGAPASTLGLLLLTQSAPDDAFGGLRAGAVGDWSLAATTEPMTMVATRADTAPLILVAGRQVVTAEDLEVLALGAPGPFVDGHSVDETIEAIRRQGGVPVIPWGFGKWWRHRGAIVRRLIADHAQFPLLFVGDSACRPGVAPRPKLLAEAERQHRVVLPGTDPLPLAEESKKAGRLVFAADCTIDFETPFAGLKQWLAQCKTSPPASGEYERIRTFVRRQIAMQRRKRRKSP